MKSETKNLTVEEYFVIEDESELRNEYVRGQVYPKDGETRQHSQLGFRISGLIYSQLKDSSCGGYSNSLRLSVNDTAFVYPDFTVVCGQAHISENVPDTLTNPTMIVEIMSDSSRYYDRYIKAELYLSITSVEIYLIIDATKHEVALYTRQDNGWLIQFYTGLAAVVPLDAINAQLKLSALYKTIQFPEDENLEND